MKKWSLGNIEKLQNCPFCQASLSSSISYSRRDDTLSLPDKWRVYKCKSCDSMYLNPRPDKDSLPLAYKNYYTHQSSTDNKELSDSSLVSRLVNGYLNYRFSTTRQNSISFGSSLLTCLPPLRMKLDIYGRNIPKKMCNSESRLLDVGCGNGEFLLRAKEMGIDVYGVEPDPVAASNCQSLGLNVSLGNIDSFKFQRASFDYITLNHVIEHVPDPLNLLSNLHSLLKPNGHLWLGLPNPSALGVKVFGKAWKGFHPPFHLLIPSQKILKRWLENAGFEDVKFIRRGQQSKGLWRESQQLAIREDIKRSPLLIIAYQIFGDILASTLPNYCEETIITAKRPKD